MNEPLPVTTSCFSLCAAHRHHLHLRLELPRGRRPSWAITFLTFASSRCGCGFLRRSLHQLSDWSGECIGRSQQRLLPHGSVEISGYIPLSDSVLFTC